MAGSTLGHDRIPVSLARAISVKGVMTALAGKAVPAAIILKVVEQTRVTLGALGSRERLRFNSVL